MSNADHQKGLIEKLNHLIKYYKLDSYNEYISKKNVDNFEINTFLKSC